MALLFIASSPFHLEMLASLRRAMPEHEIAGLADSRIAGRVGDLAVLAPDIFMLSGKTRMTGARTRARAARETIRSIDASCVIVGNDVAPLERAMVHAARAHGLPTVLLQDGLFPAWEWRRARVTAAQTAMRWGAVDLAPTVYGTGETDHVGALGEAWIPAFRRLRRPRAVDVVAVGNVAYAETARAVASHTRAEWKRTLDLPDERLAVFYASNELHGHGPVAAVRHEAQLAEIQASRRVFEDAGWCFRIRLHPSDDAEAYGSLAHLASPLSAVPLAAAIGATDVGVVGLSAVALILAITGRAVTRSALARPGGSDLRAASWLGLPVAVTGADLIRPSVVPRDRLRSVIADAPGAMATVELIRSVLR